MDLWTLSDLSTPWCVHVVATLRIADHIASGHTEIGQLAAASGADRDSLHRVLRHLVSKGLFAERAPGRFALNEAARGLLEESVRQSLDLDAFGGRMAHAWGTLLSAVRSGKPAYHKAFGRGFWEDLDAHPEMAASFDALMGQPGHGVPDWRVLVDSADWESVRTVGDGGGGAAARGARHAGGSAADRGAVGRGVPGGGGGGSGDHRGAELFRPAAWRERPLCLEERPRRLARWRGDGHSATLRGSGATVRPGGGLHRGGTRRGGIAGAADDGPGGWQGADVGRVSRDGSAGRFGGEGGGSAGFGARHGGVPAEVMGGGVGRFARRWRQAGPGGPARTRGPAPPGQAGLSPCVAGRENGQSRA